MGDVPFAVFFAVVLGFVFVVYTSALVAAHTSARLPRALRYGSTDQNVRRRALLVEVPFGVALLGGGQLVMVAMLIHPASTLPVRLVAAAELVVAAAWLVYLRHLIIRGDATQP